MNFDDYGDYNSLNLSLLIILVTLSTWLLPNCYVI